MFDRQITRVKKILESTRLVIKRFCVHLRKNVRSRDSREMFLYDVPRCINRILTRSLRGIPVTDASIWDVMQIISFIQWSSFQKHFPQQTLDYSHASDPSFPHSLYIPVRFELENSPASHLACVAAGLVTQYQDKTYHGFIDCLWRRLPPTQPCSQIRTKSQHLF